MEQKSVLVRISGSFFGSPLLSSIMQYAREANWLVELWDEIPNNWFGDGVIADYASEEELRRLRDFETVPMVMRANNIHRKNVAVIRGEGDIITQTAVDFFLSRGFSNHAVIGLYNFPDDLKPVPAVYKEILEKRVGNYSFQVHYCCQGEQGEFLDDFKEQMIRLEKFLRSLPMPCACFCIDNTVLNWIIRAAGETGLRIPEDLALLNINEVPYLTRDGILPISAVIGELSDCGRLMVQVLEHMMRYRTIPDPLPMAAAAGVGIISRRSTDRIACEDAEIKKLLQFVEDNFAAITIADMADFLNVSLSQLKIILQKKLHVTPGYLLREKRLAMAHHLLKESSLSIDDIAHQCGYSDKNSLTKTFLRLYGYAPGHFRINASDNSSAFKS